MATATFTIPPVSADPAIEAENVRLHEIHDAGYEACYDGSFAHHNPHTAGSIEHGAWESGYLQAKSVREEWELCNRERAQQRNWLEGADLV